MHARYKREHGSDGPHRMSTTRGLGYTARPDPKALAMEERWLRSNKQKLAFADGKFKTTPVC
jgi:hypothetical protein